MLVCAGVDHHKSLPKETLSYPAGQQPTIAKAVGIGLIQETIAFPDLKNL